MNAIGHFETNVLLLFLNSIQKIKGQNIKRYQIWWRFFVVFFDHKNFKKSMLYDKNTLNLFVKKAS